MVISTHFFSSFDTGVSNDRIHKRHKHAFAETIGITMKGVLYPRRWEEEWYTSWQTMRKNEGPRTSKRSMMKNETPDDWGEQKQVGTILNVRHRVGERISRVHYDHTSYLFRSKWRKKYYPKGMAR